jgi:flagellar basal body P-ring formation protein FlgA
MRGAIVLAALVAAWPAAAAELRPYVQLGSGVVHLSDLWSDLGEVRDRALGRGPAPGARITVGAAQLEAIARDFGVDWRVRSGNERVMLERPAALVEPARIRAALEAALRSAGAPETTRIEAPLPAGIQVPAGAPPRLTVAELAWDRAGGRFTAMLSVDAGEGEPQRFRLSGEAQVLVRSAVLTHRVRAGERLREEDVAMAAVPEASLRGGGPLEPRALVGQALRHEVRPGQALLAADIVSVPLVVRGGEVRMRLAAGGIEVIALGRALEGGGAGDRIRVSNPASRAVLLAEVTGEGEVRVDPSAPPVQAGRAGLDVAFAP